MLKLSALGLTCLSFAAYANSNYESHGSQEDARAARLLLARQYSDTIIANSQNFKSQTTKDTSETDLDEEEDKNINKRLYLFMAYAINFGNTHFEGSECYAVSADVAYNKYDASLGGEGIGCYGTSSIRYSQGTFESNKTLTVGLGTNLNTQLRTSFEFSVRKDLNFEKSEDILDTYYSDDGYQDVARQSFANMNNYTMMFNLYFDFFGKYNENDNKKFITPYLGLGVGYALNEIRYFESIGTKNQATSWSDFSTSQLYNYELYLGREKNYDFAWQFTFGIAMQITPNSVIDFGYRYLDLGNVYTSPTYYLSQETTGVPDRNGVLGSDSGTYNRLKADLILNELFAGLRVDF
jgi:opacity protein-like surface antigen